MAYYLLIDDEQTGPLEIEAVATLIERGEITLATMAWTKGMDDWAPAGDVAELADLFEQPGRPNTDNALSARPPWLGDSQTGPVGGAGAAPQPLNIGLVFNQTFEGFGRQPVAALLVALVYNLVATAVLVAVFGAAATFGPGTEQTSAEVSQPRISMIGVLAMMVVMPIAYGGLSVAMLNLVRGEPVRLGQLLAGISRAPTLVGFWFVYALGCALGLIVFFLPGVFVAVSFMLTPFVIVESQLGIIESMKAGFRAVIGLGWWQCLLLIVVLFMGILLASVVVQALITAFPVALFGVIVTLAINSVVTVVMAASLAAAYEQARANQERTNTAGPS